MIQNTKLEPVMAGAGALFNYFIFSTIGYAVLALSSTTFNIKAPIIAIKLVPFLAILTAVYFQFRQSRRETAGPLFMKLTPGEIMVGFKQRPEGKEWAPALKGHKFWWLLLSIVNFMVIGGYWHFLSNGYVYNWVELLLRIALSFLFFGAMITVGNGRSTAFLGILVVIGLDYSLTPYLYSPAAAVANGYFTLPALVQLKSALWAALNSMGLIYYLYHQNPEQFKATFTRLLRGRRTD
ncbi:hypothetical protein EBR57_00770 [bacterium]|nr:hypothetical protein [bacterium]